MKKVVVIGAGNVGAHAAHYAASLGLGEVSLLDVVPGLAAAKAADYNLSRSAAGYAYPLRGSGDFSDLRGADVVIHTAGIARKPGMDRMDLLKTNVKIARDVSEKIKFYAPESVIIVVANPLDVIAMTCYRCSGFPKERVIGMAGVLDSSRFCWFLAEHLGVEAPAVQAMVLGGHGDSMVPLRSYSSAGGIQIDRLVEEEALEAMEERTRKGGGEIVKYLKTGSAFYAPAASAVKMTKAVLTGRQSVVPASVLLEGEYGQEGIFLGVPILIGKGGIRRILELPLSAKEKKALAHSAGEVAKGVATLETLL